MAKQSNFTSLYPPKKKASCSRPIYNIHQLNKKRADENHQLFF